MRAPGQDSICHYWNIFQQGCLARSAGEVEEGDALHERSARILQPNREGVRFGVYMGFRV